MYSVEELQILGRKELQAVAKQFNIKANQSSTILIRQIVSSNENSKNNSDEPKSLEKEILQEKLEEITEQNTESLKAGDIVEAFFEDEWKEVKIVKVNKKTVRVKFIVTNNDKTIELKDIRKKRNDLNSEPNFNHVVEDVEVCVRRVSIISSAIAKANSPSHFSKQKVELSESNDSEAKDINKNEIIQPSFENSVTNVTEPTFQWAVSMESCLQEMVGSKSLFKPISVTQTMPKSSSLTIKPVALPKRSSHSSFSMSSTSRPSFSKDLKPSEYNGRLESSSFTRPKAFVQSESINLSTAKKRKDVVS
jgi:hypothetical protein